MKKIAILTDTTSQLVEGTLPDVFVTSIQIIEKDTVFEEGKDIDTKTIYNKMRDEKVIFKTSQPTTGNIIEKLELIKNNYDEVIAIPMGGGLSATIDGMESAAKQVGIKMYTIDSKSASGNETFLVKYALEMLSANYSANDIKTTLDKAVNDSVTFLAPSDLDHLKRGGRLTAAAALLGSILKISPVLKLNNDLNGKLDSFSKPRTTKKALETMVNEFLKLNVDPSQYNITVGDVYNEDGRLFIINSLKEAYPNIDINVVEIPAAVACHTGIGAVAFQWIKKWDFFI